MIKITSNANAKIEEILGQNEGCIGLRVRALKVGHHTFRYQLSLLEEGGEQEDEVEVLGKPFPVRMDAQSAEWLEGASIDWVEGPAGAGFQIDNPASRPKWDDPVAQRVQDLIEQRVQPSLASHGGWIELLEVDGDTAYVQLGGGCQGCRSATSTMKDGVEALITAEVDEIEHVVDRTDHSAGCNPYA